MEAQQFKQLRAKLGTQADVAEKLGLCVRFLRYRENAGTEIEPWLKYAILYLVGKLGAV